MINHIQDFLKKHGYEEIIIPEFSEFKKKWRYKIKNEKKYFILQLQQLQLLII